jgi:type IV pilus assembly protein PilO
MAQKPVAAPAGSTLDRLPKVAKAGVGLLFVVLVGLLYFVVFFGDVDNDLTSAKGTEDTLKNKLQRAEQSKVDYQKDFEEKNRREALAQTQKKILPDDPEMPAFLSAIQGVATISGVNLTSWSPVDEQPQEFYVKVPMKLTLTGKFHQVAKFFHTVGQLSVGQLDRLINVENIQIKRAAGPVEDVEVNVECLATAFRALHAGEASKRKPGAPR